MRHRDMIVLAIVSLAVVAHLIGFPVPASALDLFEPDDTTATARPIVPGESQTHLLDGTLDFMRIDASAGHSYQVDVALLEHDTYEYLYAWVVGPQGEAIDLQVVDYAWPRTVRFLAASDAPYYVHVEGAWSGGDLRTYSVSLTDIAHSTIHGTVRDMGTGDALGGMLVELYQHSIDSGTYPRLLTSTLADPSGQYGFAIDWPDQYILRFSDPTGLRVPEYSGGVVSDLAALRIGVEAGGDYVQDGQLGRPWGMQGTVRDSITGEPVPGARLTTYQDPPELAAIWTAETTADGSGHFALGGLDPHFPARVRLVDPSGVRPEQWIGPALSREDAADVTATAGTTRTADVTMGMGGTLQGKVSDGQDGSPVAGAVIKALRMIAGSWREVDAVTAGGDGLFYFRRLVTGPYRLHASDPTGRHAAEWWEDAYSVGVAVDLPVSDGATANADFALSSDVTPPESTANVPTRWVRGAVSVVITATDSGAGVESIEYLLGDEVTPRRYSGSFVLSAPGVTKIRYWATDLVGNIEPAREVSVRIDNQGPGTIHDALVSYAESATVQLAAGDALSGVAGIYSSLDGDPAAFGASTLVVRTVTEAGGHSLRFWAVDNAGNPSAETTVIFVVGWGTAMTLDAFPSVVPFLSPARVRGRVSCDGSMCAGVPVVLEASQDGCVFQDAGVRATTDAAGRFEFSVRPKSVTYYRAAFRGASGLGPSASVTARVKPQARLSTPRAPGKITARTAFGVRGALTPKHPSGSRAVRLYCYRREAGAWRLKSTKTVEVHTHDGVSQYSARLALSRKGSWLVRAYHSDTGHASSWSRGCGITVR